MRGCGVEQARSDDMSPEKRFDWIRASHELCEASVSCLPPWGKGDRACAVDEGRLLLRTSRVGVGVLDDPFRHIEKKESCIAALLFFIQLNVSGLINFFSLMPWPFSYFTVT